MTSKVQVKKFNGNYFLNIQNFLPEEILKGVIKSSNKLIESVSIASDSKTAVALDSHHGDVITGNNFHLIKLFPENVDKLITNLVNNKVKI